VGTRLSTSRRAVSRAFTLIELLVVIAVIGILITIVTTVGASAISGGKARQTRDTIRLVDAAVTTYINDTGNVPPAFVAAFAPQISPAFDGADFAAYPLADAVDLSGGEANRTRINSMGLFLRALDDVGLTDTLGSVNPAVLTRWDGDADPVDSENATIQSPGAQPELRTILDGWGRPLRFVHPAWDGLVTQEDNQGNLRITGQPGTGVLPIWDNPSSPPPIGDVSYWLEANRAPAGYDPASQGQNADFPITLLRRNFLTDADRDQWSGAGPAIGDSDGGSVVGGVPYIYSAGEDGDPSTLDGNVYTTEPRRPVTQ
jgi:prepilin-type N-terminal cleavage/methylation domain-containing protein